MMENTEYHNPANPDTKLRTESQISKGSQELPLPPATGLDGNVTDAERDLRLGATTPSPALAKPELMTYSKFKKPIKEGEKHESWDIQAEFARLYIWLHQQAQRRDTVNAGTIEVTLQWERSNIILSKKTRDKGIEALGLFLQNHANLIPHNITLKYSIGNQDCAILNTIQGTGLINYGESSFIKQTLETHIKGESTLDYSSSLKFSYTGGEIAMNQAFFPQDNMRTFHEAGCAGKNEAVTKIYHETNRLYGKELQTGSGKTYVTQVFNAVDPLEKKNQSEPAAIQSLLKTLEGHPKTKILCGLVMVALAAVALAVVAGIAAALIMHAPPLFLVTIAGALATASASVTAPALAFAGAGAVALGVGGASLFRSGYQEWKQRHLAELVKQQTGVRQDKSILGL